MSKLQQLIDELCPNGVEFKELGSICKYTNGKGHEANITGSGKYIVVNSKFVSTEGTIAKYSNVALLPVYNDDVLMVLSDLPNGKALAKCFIVEEDDKYTLNQRIASLRITEESIKPRFLFYYLDRNVQLTRYNNGVDQTNLTKSQVLKIKIPIPPLEVQNEIVRILDKFTELIAELIAELEARKKQYESYRNKLILCDDESITYKISDIGKVKMCKRILKDQTNSVQGVPFYKIGTFGKKADAYISDELFAEYRNSFSYPVKGDILISASGTIGRTVVYDGEPAYFQDSNIVWLENDEKIVSNRFLKFFYKTNPWTTATGGTIDRLYNSDIYKVKISVPSIEKQNNIVYILEKLEEITESITNGIPAEIERREKQYEYYRAKLLFFNKDN